MSKRRGWYCSACGAKYSTPGAGFITCGQCGASGLRGFNGRLRRVQCFSPGCTFTGWDDGGVNDDLGQHLRLVHLTHGKLLTAARLIVEQSREEGICQSDWQNFVAAVEEAKP